MYVQEVLLSYSWTVSYCNLQYKMGQDLHLEFIRIGELCRSAHEQYSSAQSLSSWVHGIAATVLTQYIVNVTDVLTNVTKVPISYATAAF